MEQRELNDLLAAVAAGEVTPEDAAIKLRTAPYSDLGYAKVDHHRGIRQGASEVIYGAGKTPDQIAGIIANMIDAGQERVLITRIGPDEAREVEQLLSSGLSFAAEDADADCGQMPEEGGLLRSGEGLEGDKAAPGEESLQAGGFPSGDERSGEEGAVQEGTVQEGAIPDIPLFTYYDVPRLAIVGDAPEPSGTGRIVVACGGTSDLYAAEEAALTAETMGNEVVRLYDVGVAGLHRLLSHADELAGASVVIVVAGMEGALPSVVGGLVSCPVIAVPTSVGYGASFQGLSALLAMLNSCASGVSVVNIDNGFGAGYQASLINHL